MSENNDIKSVYDSSKNWQWAPDEEFSLSGRELEYIYKAITELLSRPESISVLKALETHKILEAKISQGVEKGIVIEAQKVEG